MLRKGTKSYEKENNINSVAVRVSLHRLRKVGTGRQAISYTLVEISQMEEKYTAMHVAAWSTSREIIKFLIEHGGDCTIKDSNGKTPYKWAKKLGIKENMELLKL